MRLSRLFRLICRIMLVLLVLLSISVTVPQIFFATRSGSGGLPFIPTMLVLQLIWGVILFLFERLFDAFAKGGVFDSKAVRCLKWIGRIFCAGAALKILAFVVFLIQNSEQIAMSWTFVGVIGELLLGILILLMAAILEEAGMLKEEQQLTV